MPIGMALWGTTLLQRRRVVSPLRVPCLGSNRKTIMHQLHTCQPQPCLERARVAHACGANAAYGRARAMSIKNQLPRYKKYLKGS